MILADIAQRAASERLEVLGGFHPTPEDGLPTRIKTLVLLGPAEPGFWPHVLAAPEFQDKAPDPLDRWSRRTIGTLACDLGAKAYFPFGGPPYRPFIAWAQRSGQAWSSEVGLLVHATQGLLVSYRGALGLSEQLDLPSPATRPCDTCTLKPCTTACPVDALSPAGYDIPACETYLSSNRGQSCMKQGCNVRLSCPVSKTYARAPEQSAYHMKVFLG